MTTTTTIQRLSFEEYVAYDNGTSNRYELVDGDLIKMNPLTFRHMLIAKFVEQCLDTEIRRLGLQWLCFRAAGVRTGVRKSRLTDVYILTLDQVSQLLDASAIS